MSFFIAEAMAADPAAATQTGGLASFLPLIILFAVFYFLLIRPQSKRAKEQKNMIAALEKGDEVVTSGGVLGSIVDLDESYVTLKIAENVEIKVQRPAISTALPKGTIKNS
ncbi:MAG: preprotein translocase subunit YajC [Gammaproteobacteria bacterium]|nr:preprotein translocase subunit YajC [Gammaproteobacteria bacterium]